MAPPPAPATGAGQGDGTSRLRLRPRLNLPSDAPTQAATEAVGAPPPPPIAGFPIPEPDAAADPELEEIPRFKLRPKAAAAPPAIADAPPPPEALAGAPPPPPPPSFAKAPAPRPQAFADAPPPPLPKEGGSVPPLPPPGRPSQSMPPMSILTAAPPPPPGSVAEPPAPPGTIPRLSLSTAQDKALPKGPQAAGADVLQKIGGKPVVKPGKTAAVLRKRPALSPVAKVGLTVVVIALAVGAFYSYRIFFPAPSQEMKIKLPAVAKPIAPADLKQSAQDALSKANKGQNATAGQSKADASVSSQQVATPTPIPTSGAVESVMGESNISKDVRVSSTPIDAELAASAAFRSFVANATIGGVFQGIPSRALINGTVVREGQVVDSALGIAFERVDPDKKIIYFKDYNGAVVSKGY
ncbi:MAG TPA: hypothetical protein VN775_10405 [Opitutaceae bacterium]|nr:hypothetical protein [Opitutaceae bacterium]